MLKRNRWTALILAGVLGTAAAVSPLTARDAMAGHTYSRVDGAYRMMDGTAIDGVVARGVDVSHWKGAIDWNAVASDDIQFVMLGTTYNKDVDPNFRTNASGAAAAGLKVGAYLYSYATTPEMASAEADFVLDLIKDYPISYPVAFDAESSALGTLSPQQISEIINTFCKKIENAGYYPMVYANDYWLANKIDLSMMHYDVWVARYEVKHVYANPVMWQATQTGSVNGINGNVDIDFQYKDFSSLIPASRWRTIGGQTYYYQDYVMQKDAWIQDGTGWFYMGSDSQAMKGWQKINGQFYYLDSESGRMASGWLKQGEYWYYLGSSGAMKTGWVNVDESFYLLDENGVMQTGWYTAGDDDYYLSPSGQMATGWKEIDGSWYFFGSDGRKYSGWLEDGGQTYFLDVNGKMATGWQMLDNSWYFFNSSGQRLSGMISLDHVLYYLDPATGIMAANTTVMADGEQYQADASGVCTKIVPESTDSADGAANAGTDGSADAGTNDSNNGADDAGSSFGDDAANAPSAAPNENPSGPAVEKKGPGEL